MGKQTDIYHDVNNAIVIIKRTARSLEPIIERIMDCCHADNFRLTEIATHKQLNIAQKSMKTIGEQCEILLQWIDRIQEEHREG